MLWFLKCSLNLSFQPKGILFILSFFFLYVPVVSYVYLFLKGERTPCPLKGSWGPQGSLAIPIAAALEHQFWGEYWMTFTRVTFIYSCWWHQRDNLEFAFLHFSKQPTATNLYLPKLQTRAAHCVGWRHEATCLCHRHFFFFSFLMFIYLFIWLCQVLAAACRVSFFLFFSCGMQNLVHCLTKGLY